MEEKDQKKLRKPSTESKRGRRKSKNSDHMDTFSDEVFPKTRIIDFGFLLCIDVQPKISLMFSSLLY
jgi:hypothetical protein